MRAYWYGVLHGVTGLFDPLHDHEGHGWIKSIPINPANPTTGRINLENWTSSSQVHLILEDGSHFRLEDGT